MTGEDGVSLKREIIGCGISLLTVLMFTLGSVAVQALDGLIPDFELNVIRLSGPILATSVFLGVKRIVPVVPRRCYVHITSLCLLASWLTFTMYVAVELLPIGSAGSLYHAVWMMAVSVAARLVLKETITPVRWSAICLCVGGSALVVTGLLTTVRLEDPSDQPGEVTTATWQRDYPSNVTTSPWQHDNNTTIPWQPPSNVTTAPWHADSGQHHMTTTVGDFALGVFICVASGLIEMSVVTFTKLMEDHVEHVFILSFWCSVSGVCVSGVLMLLLERDRLTFPTDPPNLLYLSAHTVCTGVACVIYFLALRFGSAVVCSIALNAEIPLRVLFQYVLARDLQPIEGSVYDVVGACVVTLGVLLPPLVDLVKLKVMSDKEDTEVKKKLLDD